MARQGYILDVGDGILAEVLVEMDSKQANGILIWEKFPNLAKAILDEYRDLVDNQILSLVDQVEASIKNLGYKFRLAQESQFYSITCLYIKNDTVGFFIDLLDT